MAGGIFQRLRDAFRPAKPSSPAASRQLLIEEDEFGQIEVLPASAADWCAQQIGEIAAFSARHEVPGGMGWTDIYVRQPAPVRLGSLNIPLAATVEAIGRHLPRFDEVRTWSSPEPIPGVRAFGPSGRTGIILTGDNSKQNLKSIDVFLWAGRPDAAAVFTALASLPSPEPLIVVDWNEAACVRLDRPDEVEAYLARFDA
jgi:hypothetical protein